jgi:betaine-aldehyde dehydrogenase
VSVTLRTWQKPRVSRAMQLGAVWIDAHRTGSSETPHGGFEQSGYGKDEYTNVTHVVASLAG